MAFARRPQRLPACILAATMLVTAIGGVAVPAATAWTFLPPPAPWYDPRPIEDQLEILERNDQLLAIDAWTGAVAALDLRIDEAVLWRAVHGRIAFVVTDERLLAAVPGFGWNERELGVSESGPLHLALDDRVAIVATDRRVLGFDGLSGTWSQSGLGPREKVLAVAAGTNVAVAATRTRVLGVAAGRGGLSEADLGIREPVESIRAHGSFATVATPRRILTFRAPDGTWQATDVTFRR